MASWCVFVFGIFALSCQVGGELNKYENYTLMRIFPNSGEEVTVVSSFQDPMGEVELLKGSRGMNDSLDVLVPPARMDFVMDFVNHSNVTYEIKQNNYGRALESLDRIPRRRNMRPSSFNMFAYNSYQKILDFTSTVELKYPNLVTVQNVGNSYQGRPMKLVKISSNPHAGNPIIFIDAGIHAREWVAPAMAMYLINRLTSDPDAIRNDLEGVDWYILPVVNPDGYEYTRSSSSNRMWRKTRSRNGICFGVDGNRNYGFKWAVSGVSKNPCDRETYAGPRPFSETETQIVRNIMMENAKRIKLYVSLHAYGQYLVYPWGYTEDALPKDWKKLDNLARKVSNAVQRAGGNSFKVLSAGKWYPAAGGSDDYAFGAVGIPYSYTMELTDGYEFIFPENLLKKVLPQFYMGFREFGAQIKNEYCHGQCGHQTSFNNKSHERSIFQTAAPPMA